MPTAMVPVQPSVPPSDTQTAAVAATATTTHPFFKTTTEKRLEMQKQKEEVNVSAETTSATPTNGSLQTTTKSKRTRAPKSNAVDGAPHPVKTIKSSEPSDVAKAPRLTRAAKSKAVKKQREQQEQQEQLELIVQEAEEQKQSAKVPSLPLLLSQPPPINTTQSTETLVEPVAVTPTTLISSSSSSSRLVEVEVEVEAEVDLNQDRRKRRKTTPPSSNTSVKVIIDTDTNLIMSSPVVECGNGLVEWNSPTLTIRAKGKIKPEDLLAKAAQGEPSSPIQPTVQVLASSPIASGSTALRRRTTVFYDKGTQMLTIKSSPPMAVTESAPPPPEPVRRDLFAVLGKKKEPKQDPKEESKDAPAERKPGKRPRGGKKKEAEKDNKEEPVMALEPKETPEVSQPTTISPPDVTETPAAPKVVHPFFNPAQRKKMAQAAPSGPELPAVQQDEVKATSTETSPKPSPKKAPRQANFGSSFMQRPKKIPGMIEAPWPVMGTSHIRSIDTSLDVSRSLEISTDRKMKSSTVTIGRGESIFERMAIELGIKNIRVELQTPNYEERKYRSVAPEVRMPERIVTTGSKLQEMVRLRVKARLPHPNPLPIMSAGSDTDSDISLSNPLVHPILERLYARLRTSLAPFDERLPDNISWDAKYAPISGGEVLQPGREMHIFASWLRNLKTDQLDTGKHGKRKAKRDAPGSKKNKRKKRRDEDGIADFIVNSDEEVDMMDEISDPEEREDDWLNPQQTKSKKSTIRAGDKFETLHELFNVKPKDSKKTNAVLISGPTGCGKTAAVYAIAKELDFIVFEIPPGMRRNGKDLLEHVGDMSRNHLVHQQKQTSTPTDPFSLSKQQQQRPETPIVCDDAPVHQQQSLIFLEEVDILFEEDKTFWASVSTLMAKSKRPIVMTCTDESLVPLDTLCLHAVLRFVVPAHELVLDKLLLVAANEGHLLDRVAVAGLLDANNGDIRATLMNLQWHSRIGVGDRTGTMAWQLQRWPKGSDVDASGEQLRVVSVGTYQPGMGLVSNERNVKEEDRLRFVWDEYGIDVGAGVQGLDEWSRSMANMKGLEMLDKFFEARSAADAYGGTAMWGVDALKLDPTLPRRSGYAILDDQQGLSVLQADSLVIPGSISTDISLYTRSLARQFLTNLPPIEPSSLVTTITNRHSHNAHTPSRITYPDTFAALSKLDVLFASSNLPAHSCIYPSLTPLVVDVAPWVRSIVRVDVKRETERRRTSKMLNIGGKGKVRMTRAARLAGEGGCRGVRERWLRGVGASVFKTAPRGCEEINEVEGEVEDDLSGSGGGSS